MKKNLLATAFAICALSSASAQTPVIVNPPTRDKTENGTQPQRSPMVLPRIEQ